MHKRLELIVPWVIVVSAIWMFGLGVSLVLSPSGLSDSVQGIFYISASSVALSAVVWMDRG